MNSTPDLYSKQSELWVSLYSTTSQISLSCDKSRKQLLLAALKAKEEEGEKIQEANAAYMLPKTLMWMLQ